jgi:hypothetical protein
MIGCVYAHVGRVTWEEALFNPEPVGDCDGQMYARIGYPESEICERHLVQLFSVGMRPGVVKA